MDSCLIVIVRLPSKDVQAPQLDWLPDWWTRDWWTTVVPCAARSVLRITATRCIEIGEQERTREDRRDEEREGPPPRRAPPRWRDRWDSTRKRKWWGARLRGCALRSAGAASTHRSVIPRCTKKTNDRATTEPRQSHDCPMRKRAPRTPHILFVPLALIRDFRNSSQFCECSLASYRKRQNFAPLASPLTALLLYQFGIIIILIRFKKRSISSQRDIWIYSFIFILP